MFTKSEKGFSGIDVIISIIIITIFITMIGNLIININLNSKDIERKTIATSYAIQEIEKIKSQGYIDDYKNKGIEKEDIIEEKDIKDSTGAFSGYHKKIIIKDYVLISKDNTKEQNKVKEVTVEISYKLGNKEKNIRISTYITSRYERLKNSFPTRFELKEE